MVRTARKGGPAGDELCSGLPEAGCCWVERPWWADGQECGWGVAEAAAATARTRRMVIKFILVVPRCIYEGFQCLYC